MDYTSVTELPGHRITLEALAMAWTRYAIVRELSAERQVLEVGCGAGQGLGLLAKRAGFLVGGDYTEGLLRAARRHYGGRIPLVRLDAHVLPFRGGTFDVVILYEAFYYLAHPEMFLRECRRVLHRGGILALCSVNREWSGFNPSPFSTRYLSAREVSELLQREGFGVDLFGAFPVGKESAKDRLVSVIKRTAVGLHLVPRTMKGKEFLKRVFLGRLTQMPPELMDGMAERQPLVPLRSDGPVTGYKVLYAIGRRGSSRE
jgi:SAM-dependent methyltransferase